MKSAGRLTERDLSGLRTVLNDWDPIGVFHVELPGGEWPEDEYDCIRWPLVSRLQDDASRTDIAEFLVEELDDHFGLDVTVTDELLDKLFAWWRSLP